MTTEQQNMTTIIHQMFFQTKLCLKQTQQCSLHQYWLLDSASAQVISKAIVYAPNDLYCKVKILQKDLPSQNSDILVLFTIQNGQCLTISFV